MKRWSIRHLQILKVSMSLFKNGRVEGTMFLECREEWTTIV